MKLTEFSEFPGRVETLEGIPGVLKGGLVVRIRWRRDRVSSGERSPPDRDKAAGPWATPADARGTGKKAKDGVRHQQRAEGRRGRPDASPILTSSKPFDGISVAYALLFF